MVSILFWASIAIIAYSYVIYPLLLAALRMRAQGWQRSEKVPVSSVSIVIAARNEERRIVACVESLRRLLSRAGIQGEVLIVSDGSTDETARRVRQLDYPEVRVIEFQQHHGKSVAINRGCDLAKHEIVVLTDTRQHWAPDALWRLLQNFADPNVGAAGAELVLQRADGMLAGVGLYWRLEKWMRRQEARIHSSMGVSGAACALRRDLFQPIPAGTILDDVYWPMRVLLAGYRVVHDEKAVVYDRLPVKQGDELRRKIRTLSGNYQLLWRLPALLLPWKNPVFFQFVSHKVSRLVVPWAMIAAMLANLRLDGALYATTLALQSVLYGLAITGMVNRRAATLPVVSAASAVVFLNGACLAALFVWLTGGIRNSWHCANYEGANCEGVNYDGAKYDRAKYDRNGAEVKKQA